MPHPQPIPLHAILLLLRHPVHASASTLSKAAWKRRRSDIAKEKSQEAREQSPELSFQKCLLTPSPQAASFSPPGSLKCSSSPGRANTTAAPALRGSQGKPSRQGSGHLHANLSLSCPDQLTRHLLYIKYQLGQFSAVIKTSADVFPAHQ